MKIWSALEKIFVVIIKVFSMISSPLKELTKFIHTFLTQKFGKNLVRALLVMAVLVVINFVIYSVYEWFTGQHSKEIPPSITFSEQKSEEYDPTSPPLLEIDPKKSRFTENTLDAMETGNIVIHIRNEGAGDANNLTIQLIQLSNDLQGLSFDSITKVPPVSKNGGEQRVEIPVTGTASLSDGKAKIGIYLVESDFEQKIPIKPLIFKTRRLRTPELVLVESAVNEKKSASPNNRIDLNEEIELKFHVSNIGVGVAKEVNVKVKNEQTGVRLLEKTDETKNITRTFSEIKPGDYQTITYNYFINSQFTERELIFKIIGTEKQGKYGFSKTKEFSIDNRIGEGG